jgi:hypothetical protein
MADVAQTIITTTGALAKVAVYISNKLQPEHYLAQAREALRNATEELRANGQYMDRAMAESLREASMQ